MQAFLYHSAMGEEDFFRYREILDWFHYQCYFNIENVAQYRDEAERLLDDEKITPEMAEDPHICHTHLTDVQRRRNLLSLTSPEWLALVGKAHPEHQLWGKVKARENSCYLLEKEDDEFLYVKDLCSEDEGEFKITKKSLNLSAIRSREVGKAPYLRTDLFWQHMVAVRHASRKQVRPENGRICGRLDETERKDE